MPFIHGKGRFRYERYVPSDRIRKRSGPPIPRSHSRRQAAVATVRRPSYPNAPILRPFQASTIFKEIGPTNLSVSRPPTGSSCDVSRPRVIQEMPPVRMTRLVAGPYPLQPDLHAAMHATSSTFDRGAVPPGPGLEAPLDGEVRMLRPGCSSTARRPLTNPARRQG